MCTMMLSYYANNGGSVFCTFLETTKAFDRVNYVKESGDSSVVTRWTVDQDVVGSNPTHGGNLISVVRSLSGFTQPIR